MCTLLSTEILLLLVQVDTQEVQAILKSSLENMWLNQTCGADEADIKKMLRSVTHFVPYYGLTRPHAEELVKALLNKQELALTGKTEGFFTDGVKLRWDADVIKFLTDRVG
jgi:hypothetical protein